MKDKIITFLFIGYIFVLAIMHILIPDLEISFSERRTLAKFPKFEFNSEYITKVDKYLLDHFPLRDKLRSIKALYNYKVLNKLDNNGIYLKNDSIYKSNYPTNKKSINNFVNHIEVLKGSLTKQNKVYMMIIPDKNYYLEEKDFLRIDYDYIYKRLEKLDITNIDVRDILNENDYYKTDTHWKQENLNKVVKRLGLVMNFDYEEREYKQNVYDKFYGVYYGESAMNFPPDKITYLTNYTIDNITVNYLENKNLKQVYNIDKLNGIDSYEVYLDGASAFIEIFNNNAKEKKELVIFRDSFASSISPLLINYYSKITLIDNRYISSSVFNSLIEFNNQDVLFMYSTLIINNSGSLKK
jgi:hypothetical protein